MGLSRQQTLVLSGGGIAGLSLALALRQATAGQLGIVLADPALARARHEVRAYALSEASRQLLVSLGIWDAIADQVQPITGMDITDSRTHDPVRPVFLRFDDTDAADNPTGEHLGHMVESAVLMQALEQACRNAGIDLRPLAVREAISAGQHVDVTFSDLATIQATLVVAADGNKSRLRDAAGLGWVNWGYGQSGIVATIGHERDHGGRAVEHFLPSGPFAILPLVRDATGFRSSIVWTEQTQNVEALLALDSDDQKQEIERRFGLQLGEISLLSRPQAWPLSFGMARRFVGERLALMGDAAHVIHPLAGQGLNLGLKDTAVLAEVIVDAMRLGLDIGARSVLADYERQRRPDTLLMAATMEGMNRLFSNDITPVRLLRDLGLGLVDRLPSLKKALTRQASGSAMPLKNGEASRIPRLLRGEAL